MFKKLYYTSIKALFINAWYYVRFYFLAYLTKRFKNPPNNGAYKSGYDLVFRDEFNESKIDWEKWAPCESWGCIRNNPDTNLPQLIYKPEQVTVENGCAVLTTAVNPPSEIYTEYESQTPEPKVKSGQLVSHKCFVQKYGYFETREKLPAHGFDGWAAFWGYPVGKWPPEIDVFELMGENSSFITMTMHQPDWDTNKKAINDIFATIYDTFHYLPKNVDDAIAYLRDPWTPARQELIDKVISLRKLYSRSRRLKFPGKDFLANDFHTYGLLWTPKKVVWYIDNIPVYYLDKHIPDDPFHWLITNAVKDRYVEPPSTLPLSVYCDYFRAYKESEPVKMTIYVGGSSSSNDDDATNTAVMLAASTACMAACM